MYRLKPQVTYPRWAAFVGVVALALAGPNLIAGPMPAPQPTPIVLGDHEMGLRCEEENLGFYTSWDCGDTIVQTLESGASDDQRVSVERFTRALIVDPDGQPVQIRPNLWVQQVVTRSDSGALVPGTMVASFEDDASLVWVSYGVQEEQFTAYAISMLSDDADGRDADRQDADGREADGREADGRDPQQTDPRTDEPPVDDVPAPDAPAEDAPALDAPAEPFLPAPVPAPLLGEPGAMNIQPGMSPENTSDNDGEGTNG